MSEQQQVKAEVTFEKVPVEEREALWEMLQVHLRELSQFDPELRARHGSIPYIFFDLYWSDPALRMPFFILCRGERVGLLLVSEGERPSYGYPFRCVEVSEIYVAPAFRRRGIGRRAMEFALSIACERGVPLLWSCYAGNTRALRLYYSFVAACEVSRPGRVVITGMVDGHGCDRKNFRLEPCSGNDI